MVVQVGEVGSGNGQAGPGVSGGKGGWVRMLGAGARGSVGIFRVGIVRGGRLVLASARGVLVLNLCCGVGLGLVPGLWHAGALVLVVALVVLGW